MLKKSVNGMSFWLRLSLLPSFFFSPQLSGNFHRGGFRLAGRKRPSSITTQRNGIAKDMSHSLQGIKKRILQYEKLAAKKIHAAKICNCRSMRTSYHDAKCLEEILMNIRFWWVPSWALLRYREGGDDNWFCPCPPDPWRTQVWKGLYRTDRQTNDERWAESDAARKASADLPPKPPVSFEEGRRQLEEDNRRIDAVIERYKETVHQWIDSGRKPPGPRERFRQATAGESEHVDG